MHESLLGSLRSELGEVGVTQPIPLQRVGVTPRNGREIATGPDEILESLEYHSL